MNTQFDWAAECVCDAKWLFYADDLVLTSKTCKIKLKKGKNCQSKPQQRNNKKQLNFHSLVATIINTTCIKCDKI